MIAECTHVEKARRKIARRKIRVAMDMIRLSVCQASIEPARLYRAYSLFLKLAIRVVVTACHSVVAETRHWQASL